MDAYLVSGGIIAGRDQSFVQEFFNNLDNEVGENGLDELEKELTALNKDIDENIETMINKLSLREITDLVSQKSRVSKKEIYNYCLKLKNEK